MIKLWIVSISHSPVTVLWVYFPQNTLACYTTKLFHPVVLDKGEWETAVVEVHYTSSFQNVSEYTNSIYYRASDKEQWKITKIIAAHYYDVNDILSQINYKKDLLNLVGVNKICRQIKNDCS